MVLRGKSDRNSTVWFAKASAMFSFSESPNAITMNCPQTVNAIMMIHKLEKSNHDAPQRIVSAIAMQVANLLKSKPNAFCKLAMKLANSQKRARQTCGLANVTTKKFVICKI